MSFQERTNEFSLELSGSYNCRQMNSIQFSQVHPRTMTMTRSPQKKRIMDSTERKKFFI